MAYLANEGVSYLDDGIGRPKEIGRAAVVVLDHARRSRLLAQACNVPHAHGVVQRSRGNEVLLRMELGTHDLGGPNKWRGAYIVELLLILVAETPYISAES